MKLKEQLCEINPIGEIAKYIAELILYIVLVLILIIVFIVCIS